MPSIAWRGWEMSLGGCLGVFFCLSRVSFARSLNLWRGEWPSIFIRNTEHLSSPVTFYLL